MMVQGLTSSALALAPYLRDGKSDNSDGMRKHNTHKAADIFRSGNRSMESANTCFVLIALAVSRITRHLRKEFKPVLCCIQSRQHGGRTQTP